MRDKGPLKTIPRAYMQVLSFLLLQHSTFKKYLSKIETVKMFFPVTMVRKHFPMRLQGHKTFPILTSASDQQNLASPQLSLSLEEPNPISLV